MAEIVAAPLVKAVLEKISTPLLEGVWLFFGVNNDMKKLQSTLSTISSVLEDAQKKSIRDEQVRDWLKKLKSAAFEADDVMDEFQTEKLRRKIPIDLLRQSATLDAKVREFFSSHNFIVFRWKMSRKIKHVTKRLGDISEERNKYHLAEGSASEENLLTYRETHSFVMESDVYGRGGDREEVIHFLVNTDNDKDVSILPIVGLGGVGKTTLAQFVYNDDRIKTHFELKAWVCVSESFEVKIIIKNIFESITGDKCDLSNLQAIQQKLQENLRHRKFLFVLDDVWNEKGAEWENLKPLFRGGKHGSKILVTTRSSEVARIMGTVVRPYQLKGLSDGDCWTIFSQRAFGLSGQVETPGLAEIGKEIVFTKCGGLPLAAKALGSLMGSIRGEQVWLSIKNSKIWELPPEYSNNILHVLRLSYEYLPSNVKQCFLYCSLFLKDYVINKKELIQMWIAEGFIPLSLSSDEGSQFDAEDIGERYFNILLWRSFFQDEEKDTCGNVLCCKMHDLVCDLACHVAGDESCIVEVGSGCERDVSAGCHYISMVTHRDVREEIMIPKVDYKSVKLRTFLTFRTTLRSNFRSVQWENMSTHLRVMDLSGVEITELPDSLDILKHLRFLDLSWTKIRTIPDSIISLQKLQTLNLSFCGQLERLSQGIIFLSRLRHLDIFGCVKLTDMPRGIGQLTNLRMLPTFMVGKEEERGGSTIVELQHLNLIRGWLEIRGLERVKDGREAMQANLVAKTGLQSLKLRRDRWASSSSSSLEDDVLESLRPPINLKELQISCYAGTRFPSWMTTTTTPLCLPNLVKMELWRIERWECLPPLGHLPSLQELTVLELPELVEWSTEQISTTGRRGMESIMIYPRLENLGIYRCPKLARLPPEWLFDLTALRELRIDYCPLVGTQKWRKSGEEWERTP